MTRIIALSGSSRNGSYNQTLIKIAAAGARSAGADVEIIDLNEYELPLFNEDLERKNGVPENALKLKKLFIEANGFLISSPEYNSSVSPLLKNTIDWVSRAVEGETPMAAYTGKVAGIMAASPGGLGGLRGLVHLRSILQNIGVIVVPKQVAISRAFEAFDDSGSLKEERQQESVQAIGIAVANVAAKLGG
jgi:chromate reductase